MIPVVDRARRPRGAASAATAPVSKPGRPKQQKQTHEEQREKRRDGAGLREGVDQRGGEDEAADCETGLRPITSESPGGQDWPKKPPNPIAEVDESHLGRAELQVVDEIARHHGAQTEYAAHRAEQRQHPERHVAMLEQLTDRRALLVRLRADAGRLADDARQQRGHDETRHADQHEGPTPARHLQQLGGDEGAERETEQREGRSG